MGQKEDWGNYTVTRDEDTKEFFVYESLTDESYRHDEVSKIISWIERHLERALEETD